MPKTSNDALYKTQMLMATDGQTRRFRMRITSDDAEALSHPVPGRARCAVSSGCVKSWDSYICVPAVAFADLIQALFKRTCVSGPLESKQMVYKKMLYKQLGCNMAAICRFVDTRLVQQIQHVTLSRCRLNFAAATTRPPMTGQNIGEFGKYYYRMDDMRHHYDHFRAASKPGFVRVSSGRGEWRERGRFQ